MESILFGGVNSCLHASGHAVVLHTLKRARSLFRVTTARYGKPSLYSYNKQQFYCNLAREFISSHPTLEDLKIKGTRLVNPGHVRTKTGKVGNTCWLQHDTLVVNLRIHFPRKLKKLVFMTSKDEKESDSESTILSCGKS